MLLLALLTLPPLALAAQEPPSLLPPRTALLAPRQAPPLSADAAPKDDTTTRVANVQLLPSILHSNRATPSSRRRRAAGGALIGLVIGGAVGIVHGSMGHPGLPHLGIDIPSELEYTPFFMVLGGVIGWQMSSP